MKNPIIVSEIIRVPVGSAISWNPFCNYFLARTSLGNVAVLKDTSNPECICGYMHLPHKGEEVTFRIMRCETCDAETKLFFKNYLNEDVMNGHEFRILLGQNGMSMDNPVVQKLTELPVITKEEEQRLLLQPAFDAQI